MHTHTHSWHTYKNMCYTCQTRSNIYTGMCYRAPTISKYLMIWALEPTNLPLGSTGTMTLGRKAGKLNVESVETSSITKPTALNLPPSIRVPHVGRTATLACKVSQGPWSIQLSVVQRRAESCVTSHKVLCPHTICEPALVNLILSLVRFFNLWKITQYRD